MVLAYTCVFISLGSSLAGNVVPDYILCSSLIPVDSSKACQVCFIVALPHGPPAASSFSLLSILIVFCFFKTGVFLVGLQIGFRAWHILGQHSVSDPHPRPWTLFTFKEMGAYKPLN